MSEENQNIQALAERALRDSIAHSEYADRVARCIQICPISTSDRSRCEEVALKARTSSLEASELVYKTLISKSPQKTFKNE